MPMYSVDTYYFSKLKADLKKLTFKILINKLLNCLFLIGRQFLTVSKHKTKEMLEWY